ncbi:uncharacterized protein K452DRAFT_358510 [Aplosporella prunicola CBS 121167]|uniref:Bulb-type lectin domain-containing protein n=1 Tax=Aplosporella prunicola CBS 121167 TaxID=1176127 RepID=A0A6A6BCZ1_9PEZI|nr:uncharacterized protein K452DRAFT_358510 [Aplosporella prunicola CBS 121167]KAF2142039.1 hypothetical protein K452DRAFT_358510 [Aplosporella prunicola CBS 121167]
MSKDSEGLQVVYGQEGLHSTVQQDASLCVVEHHFQDDNRFDGYQTPAAACEGDKSKRICGMKSLHFYITAAIVILIILAAAIGGGVGGGLTSRSEHSGRDHSGIAALATASKTNRAGQLEILASGDNIAGFDNATTGHTRFVFQNDNNLVVYNTSNGEKGWITLWSSEHYGGYTGNCSTNGKQSASSSGGETLVFTNKSPWISILTKNGSILWTTDDGIRILLNEDITD